MNEVKEVSLKKIKSKDNSRSTLNKDDLADLMQSIKSKGLLQPIGIVKEKNKSFSVMYGNRRLIAYTKLGYKTIPSIVYDRDDVDEVDEIVFNLSENIHRKDVSTFDLGRYISILIDDYGLSVSEVCARLSMSKGKVQNTLNIFKKTPLKFAKKIKTLSPGETKKGFIASSIVSAIINLSRKYSLSEAEIKKLFVLAQKDDSFSADKVNTMSALISGGLTFKVALKRCDDIIIVRPSIPILKKDYEMMKEIHGTTRSSLAEIIYSNKKYDFKDPRTLK